MKKIFSLKKGSFEYIKYNRIKELIISLFLCMVILALIIIGFLIYGTNKNIYTVIAAICAIPFAKFLVAYIILVPYKSIEKEKKEELDLIEDVDIFYDYVITSDEKIFCLQSIAIKDNSLYCYLYNKKIDEKYVEKYLREKIQTDCKISTIKVFKEFARFSREVKILSKNNRGRFDAKILRMIEIMSV
ncbi:hypothetical protein SAMN02910289_00720 [Lachnospiraceae bacterium RM5]|nr:hypothetical protein SAMN02910289_00720 [Lachnospiraceae bacterium RM5]